MYKAKEVKIGDLVIGGNNEIVIQSMTNTDTSNIEKTVNQILELEREGCQLVRMTVNTYEAAKAIAEIKKKVSIPLVADIHFVYKLAIEAMENGIDKLRINPGNIGEENKIKAVVEKDIEKNISIRIGVN